jgi:cytochrome c-type biogenesis protein CcmH/NrfG
MALDDCDLPAARMYLEAALAQDRGNPKTHYLLAKAALAMGDIHVASALIDRAIALGGERPEFAALRGEIAQRP